MTEEEIAKLRPEQQLELFLVQNDFPHTDIPYLLRYCPQLLQRFSIEEIALAALTDVDSFTQKKTTTYIRPFVLEAIRGEAPTNIRVYDFIEEALSVFSQDTILTTMSELIQKRQKRLKDEK